MSSPHSGQRPRDDSSAFMEEGKERVTVFLPNESHLGGNVSLWRLCGLTHRIMGRYISSVALIHSHQNTGLMSIRTVLTRLLPSDETEIVVECRQCGGNLGPGADKCPTCGSDEIEHFQISE